MGQVTILEHTPKNPLSLMGEMAGVAYGTDTTDQLKNYKRGKSCVEAGHGRVLEFCDVFMTLDGYSARVIREFMRHVAGGLTVLQASTRYIDYTNFDYIIPPKVEEKWDTARDRYICAMEDLQLAIEDLVKYYDIPKEDAANLLPLGMTTKLSCKHNVRTLMTMAEQRLCSRSYWEFRQLMMDIIKALSEYSEEWDTLCDMIFACKCDKVGFCWEEHSCGKYDKK